MFEQAFQFSKSHYDGVMVYRRCMHSTKYSKYFSHYQYMVDVPLFSVVVVGARNAILKRAQWLFGWKMYVLIALQLITQLYVYWKWILVIFMLTQLKIWLTSVNMLLCRLKCCWRVRFLIFCCCVGSWPRWTTVHLLTHVLCKPSPFFFHSFIATMSYSLQASFNSVMKDWADKYHVWGTPTRSPSRSNSR